MLQPDRRLATKPISESTEEIPEVMNRRGFSFFDS
jgi:hypothetical protein